MRARALLLALLVLLASACGAHITIRSPLRVRLGRPTAAPTPTLLVVLPFTSTPEVAAVAPTAAAPAAVAPLASPSSSPTLRPSPSATVKQTVAATPTATETQSPTTPVEPTTTPSVVPDAATPSPGGSGFSEAALAGLLHAEVPTYLIGATVVLWRLMTFWLEMSVGAVIFSKAARGA